MEWAVEMRRFDESQTLDRLAESGRIDEGLADRLGRTVAAAHRGAPTVTNARFTETLANIIAQNETELAAEPDLFSLEDLRALAAATRDAFDRVKPLLQARERVGLVRRCHGDLHLGNVVLIEDKPVLFDAIEFDDRIATGDVLYDLAFLLMDLIERGLKPAANIVFNRYLIETRRVHDLDALAALPLFMSVRAAIRAKVTAARRKHSMPARSCRGTRATIPIWRGNCCRQRSRDWSPSAGSPAPESRCSHARLRQKLYQCPAPWCCEAMSSARHCSASPRPSAAEVRVHRRGHRQVYATLAAKARRVVTAGHSAIVDAVFAQPGERADIAKAADSADFTGLFLTADLQSRLERVGARTGDASDANAAFVQDQEKFELGRINWARVDASGTPDETFIRAKGGAQAGMTKLCIARATVPPSFPLARA